MNPPSANAAHRQGLQTLQELVRDLEIAMVTTVTPDGALRSRPMFTREFNDQGEIWFFTTDDSGTVDDIASEQAVNVSYADPGKHRYVSVTGNAGIVRDRERAQGLWSNQLKKYLPRGLDDPHLALLRVRVETAEYWDTPTGTMLDLFKVGETAPRPEHGKVPVRAVPASG